MTNPIYIEKESADALTAALTASVTATDQKALSNAKKHIEIFSEQFDTELELTAKLIALCYERFGDTVAIIHNCHDTVAIFSQFAEKVKTVSPVHARGRLLLESLAWLSLQPGMTWPGATALVQKLTAHGSAAENDLRDFLDTVPRYYLPTRRRLT